MEGSLSLHNMQVAIVTALSCFLLLPSVKADIIVVSHCGCSVIIPVAAALCVYHTLMCVLMCLISHVRSVLVSPRLASSRMSISYPYGTAWLDGRAPD